MLSNMSRGAPTNSRSSMKQKMDRMDPIIRDFGRPERRNTEALLSLKTTFKLAQMVVLAFRGPRQVGPRMLGVKQNNKDGYVKNSLKPSWSAVDLSDEARRKVELSLRRSEHSSRLGSRAVFTFVQPTEKKKVTYREQQARLRRAIQKCHRLKGGSLLDTLEKGVAYPVVHVDWDLPPCDPADASGYANGAQTPLFPPSSEFGLSYNGTNNGYKKSSSSDALMQMSTDSAFSTMKSSNTKEKMSFKTQQHFRPMAEDAMGASVHVQQGLYEEVRRIEPDFAHSPRENPDERAYIVLGFKTLDTGFSSVLESTWRDWTGARAIYLRLHNQFDLSKIVFYHRVSPANDLDLFMYMVVVECWSVTPDNLINILDFVQRMRVERLNGYISLYRDLRGGDLIGGGGAPFGELFGDEADSNYHSASQESEDEKWGGGSSTCGSTFRSSGSPNSRLDEEDEEEEEEDQGIIRDVVNEATSNRIQQQQQQQPPPILVTARASETRTRTRVLETLTIETTPTVKFPNN